MTDIDDLVRKVIPGLELDEPLRPRDILDDAVVPPARVAERVEALRRLVQTGGQSPMPEQKMASSKAVAAHFGPRLRGHRYETLWVMGLSARNRPVFEHMVSKGGITGTVVGPADVLRPAIMNAAVSIVLVHNHPSGDPSPSPEDMALTERIRQAGEVLGVALVDHVIVAAGGYFSFLDAGLLCRDG